MNRPLYRIAVFTALTGSLLVGCGAASQGNHSSASTPSTRAGQDAVTVKPAPLQSLRPVSDAADTDPSKANRPIVRWDAPSGGPYPKLNPNEHVWIDVSIRKQRMYIKSGEKTLYTMVISSGIDGSKKTYTPRGTFHVQAERGIWFYAPRFHEGAKYWVSWLNHGQYLFHSVPTDQNGHVIRRDAEKLGQEDSHGCIHLTVPDAKWVYDHIPTGTKVVIHN
jgi:lipoprotein-anchoring transpeptidase ErfK/SrfK